LERLAKVCPFFEGLMNVPQPPAQHPPRAAIEEGRTCPYAAGAPAALTSLSRPSSPTDETPQAEPEPTNEPTSTPEEVDENSVIDLPVTWGGLRLCLELVDAHLTCPALGGTRPSTPSMLLHAGVEEHINAMVETAHAFGLTFVGNHVFNAFAGQPVPAHGGASDPLWIFAVVASTGSTDVLIPAAWNTLRPDFNIFQASLQGKRLLLKFARDELRELYVLHHAWHFAMQVYEDRMVQFSEWGTPVDSADDWERLYAHAGCPHAKLLDVAADASKRVKAYLYSHPVRTEQSLEEIIDKIADPVTLTDVIVPAMGECYVCMYTDGGLLDTFVRVVKESFVDVLKAELQGLRYLGTR